MLNSLQIGFLTVNLFYSSTGFLVYNYEKFIPAFVLRIVKYGAFRYEGHGAQFMTKLSLCKGYYRHFYVFSSILGILNLVYMSLVYFCGFNVHLYYIKFLHGFNGVTKPVSVLTALTALSLLILHCIRRCHETYCMQVFAQSSQVCLTHYVGGYCYYLTVYVAIVGQAPLFCGDNASDPIIWADLRTIITLMFGIPLFLWAGFEQHQSNKIFADLRKDKKSGLVVTEEHKVPHGRLFESISSPHRFCEIILYAALLIIMQTMNFLCIFLWVLCNQIQSSMLVHRWYKDTFKNYPSKRYALFIGIL